MPIPPQSLKIIHLSPVADCPLQLEENDLHVSMASASRPEQEEKFIVYTAGEIRQAVKFWNHHYGKGLNCGRGN